MQHWFVYKCLLKDKVTFFFLIFSSDDIVFATKGGSLQQNMFGERRQIQWMFWTAKILQESKYFDTRWMTIQSNISQELDWRNIHFKKVAKCLCYHYSFSINTFLFEHFKEYDVRSSVQNGLYILLLKVNRVRYSCEKDESLSIRLGFNSLASELAIFH